ncbi:hypothetical protein [uncultured Roseibium sp.]|uniref:hypothetical protein n=1 Tax=uncultured Roseibium sp. TaxID=1936171 RepID=UPI00261A1106|nr:hypothetical protein [uncultured Roseibium sp.]
MNELEREALLSEAVDFVEALTDAIGDLPSRLVSSEVKELYDEAQAFVVAVTADEEVSEDTDDVFFSEDAYYCGCEDCVDPEEILEEAFLNITGFESPEGEPEDDEEVVLVFYVG